MDNASSSVNASTMGLGPMGDDEPASSGPDVGMTINAILKIIFYVSVMILGIFGNSLILKVYWSKPCKTSTHVLIMGLAWVDLTVCVLRVYNLAAFTSVLLGRELPDIFNVISFISVVSVFASVMVTGAIALERYDCVCRRGKRLLSKFRAKLMFVASYGVAIVVCIPLAISKTNTSAIVMKTALAFQLSLFFAAFLMIVVCYGKVYGVIRKHVKVNALSGHGTGTDLSTNVARRSRRGEDPVLTGWNVWAFSPSTVDKSAMSGPGHKRVVSKVGPGPSTISGNTQHAPINRLTISAGTAPGIQPRIPHPQRRGNPTGMAEKLQQKTTRMLFVTSVVFLVCWLPLLFYGTIALHKYNGADIQDNVLLVIYNCTLFVYINNVVNPLIYGLSNRRFRKDCLDVLRKLRPC